MDAKRRGWWIAAVIAAVVVVAWVGMQCQPAREKDTAARRRPIDGPIRQAAVAGLFYPKDPNMLSAAIDGYLARAHPPAISNVRALVCPHAGYDYSGPTAAYAYKLLAGRDVRTVIILAPTHYAELEGAYIPPVAGYATPLGTVPVSAKAAELAKAECFTDTYRVHRPSWWRHSPQTLSAFGTDTPDTWEHSGEVQVPFLQKVLGDFEMVSVVVGQMDAAVLADAIEPILDEHTVVVASSDLSHYHTYEQATAKDRRCIEAICALDVPEMMLQEACGRVPILTVMRLARRHDWRATELDYRNSGDAAGDRIRVVGYAAIAFHSDGKEHPTAMTETTSPSDKNFSDEDRTFLLDLARRTIRQAVTSGTLPAVDTTNLSPRLKAPTGCFVTLTKGGQLRGCIGHIMPQAPLVEAIQDTARSAALQDPRFPPVTPSELDKIHIEISVLTVPQPLAFTDWKDLLAKLTPGRDGVVLKIGPRTSTFLPQVWDQLPDKEEFLTHLALKAGCAADAWKGKDVEVLIYHVEAFEEHEH